MSQPLSKEAVSAITAAVDAAFENEIAFLQEIVRAKSLRGEEAGVQRIVADALRSRDYDVETYPVDVASLRSHPAFSPATIDYKDTFNVSGRKTSKTSGRSLILNAHVDVVPSANPASWTHPPFAAVREGDWLFGRGAGDMKAGLAANLFAVDAIEAAGYSLQGPLEFQSVVDEEVTGNGTAAAILCGATADAVLIPEPTDEDVIYANSGVIKFKISVQGVPAHPREPESGLSAIEAAFLVINEMKALEARWNEEKTGHPGFADLRNPASLNIGTINGGEWPSSIPFECSFEGRIGFYPGDAPQDRMAGLEDMLKTLGAKDPRLEKGRNLSAGISAGRRQRRGKHARRSAPDHVRYRSQAVDHGLLSGCRALHEPLRHSFAHLWPADKEHSRHRRMREPAFAEKGHQDDRPVYCPLVRYRAPLSKRGYSGLSGHLIAQSLLC